MTFYQELQLNQAGSKNLLKKSETLKEKLYHMWVYLVKIAATMAFCFFFVSIFSILFGNENSIVGVVVLLCLMVFRNAVLSLETKWTEKEIGFQVELEEVKYTGNEGLFMHIWINLLAVSYTHLTLPTICSV